jgi:hypothetical protein
MSDKVEVWDEHGNGHYLEDDVVRAYAAVGLIWRQDERWRCEAARIDLGLAPELAVCDFCNERPVTWAIDATDFWVADFHSVDGWLACEACGAAIAAGDRATLDARAFAFIVRSGRSHPLVDAFERALLDGFWTHYQGIRRYVTPYAEEV